MFNLSRHFSNFLGAGELNSDDDNNDGTGIFSSFITPSTYSKNFQCYPVSFSGKEELEYGNKILLPQSALQQLARLNITWPMLFQVSNPSKNRKTHCGVLEFIAEDDTCYIPYWMMQNLLLREGDTIKITNVTLPKGTFVKLQACSCDFLDISNPRAVLEKSLRSYATLTEGDNIVIEYLNKTYEIRIVEVKPSKGVSIIETDIEVEFDPPIGYVEPECSTSSASLSKSVSRTNVSQIPNLESKVATTGKRLDGRIIDESSTAIESDCASAKPVQYSYDMRIPRGVRKYNEKYNELIKAGRIPGYVGKIKNCNSK